MENESSWLVFVVGKKLTHFFYLWGAKLDDTPKIDTSEILRVLSEMVANLKATVTDLSDKYKAANAENVVLKGEINSLRTKYNTDLMRMLSINRSLRARMERLKEKRNTSVEESNEQTTSDADKVRSSDPVGQVELHTKFD